MSQIKGTGKIVNVKCTETPLPEFPALLFGTHFDGRRFFDATTYLTAKALARSLNVEDFFNKFDFQIRAIANTYSLAWEHLVVINNEGHQLINGCLCYPFLSYVDPQFCTYCNEVVDELFTTGLVVSDTHLISLVKKRLTPELLNQIWDDEREWRKARPVLIFNRKKILTLIASSVNEAAKISNLQPGNISKVCTGGLMSIGMYYFRYIDQEIEIDLSDIGTLKLEEYDKLCGIDRLYMQQ